MVDKFVGDDIPSFTRPADIAVHSNRGKLADSLWDENNRLRVTFADKLLSKLLKLLGRYR